MKKAKKALASLAIASMALTMVPLNAFASDTVPTRLAGTTAADTAVQIADQTGWIGTAILASSASYGMIDALTAGPLASYLKAPILLTGPGNTLDAATKAELTKLAVKTVYVTSGTAVISQAVLNELIGMGITVLPLGGADCAETSVNIAKKMVGVIKVAVANGLQDALSIAAVASAANEPILLTEKNALPASVAAFLAVHPEITSFDVIGGTGVISDAVKAVLPNATRHAGMSAYDTNSQVIQDFNSSFKYDKVFVANGVTGIDALAGAPLAAMTNSPIVLTDGSVTAAASFVHSKLADGAVVTALGGAAVVPEAVRTGVVTGQVKPPTDALSVTSVSASSVSTFKVVFNQVVADTSKVTFEVKNLTSPVTISPTWNAAKTEAILTGSVNFPEGSYTVAVKNDTTDLGKSSVAITTQKVVKINITSTKLGVVTDTANVQTGYATYQVLDQYQNDITVSALGNGLTFQSGVGTVTAKDGLLTLDPSSSTSNLMQFATVVITGYDSTTGVSVTATLNTSTQIGTLSDFQLGALTNVVGNVLTDGNTADVFYVSFTATDISGNPTSNYRMIMGGLILHGDVGATGDSINQLTTSNSYVKATIEQDPSDSSKAVIKVVPTNSTATLSMDMPTVITAMTWTGKTSSLNTTLKKASAVDTFTLMAPAYSIAVGEAKEIPFSALDQNGVVITKFSDLDTKVTISNGKLVENVDGTAKLLVGVVSGDDVLGFASDGQQVITATTPTGKYSSLTLNIQKVAKADALSLDSSVLVSAMQTGASQFVDFGINYGGLSVKDNYGRAFDMIGNSAKGDTIVNGITAIPAYDYQVIATTSGAVTLSGTDVFGHEPSIPGGAVLPSNPIAHGAKGIQIKAGPTPGTATVTFKLYDVLEKWTTNGTVNGVTHTAGQLKTAADRTVIDSKSVTISVLADTDIKGYMIDTVANPIYAVNGVDGVAAISLREKAYAAKPKVYGTTSSGSKVILAGKPIVGINVDSTDFTVTSDQHVAYDGVRVVANKLTDTKTESSTTLAVTLKGADGLIHAVTTPIKSSTTVPSAVAIVAGVATYAPGISLNSTGDVATINPAWLAPGLIFGRYTRSGAVGLDPWGNEAYIAGAAFLAVDQYGKTASQLGQIIVDSAVHANGTAFNFVVDADGAIQTPVVDGDVIRITGITINGLLKTLQINVKGLPTDVDASSVYQDL